MPQQEADKQEQAEAANPATSAQRLEVLSSNLHLRSVIAGNPAAPTPVLEQLATDQDAQVREQVAGNPNTPWQTLEALAWEFPRAFLHNPAGPLQMLAHPEQVSTEGRFWDALLREAAIPALWWGWLNSHPDLRASEAMRLHIQSAGEVIHPYEVHQKEDGHTLLTLVDLLTVASTQEGSLFPLSPDHAPAGQSAVTCEQIVEECLQWLAQYGDDDVRRAVAKHPETPVEVLRSLATDHHALVQEDVASHPHTPIEVLHALAQHAESTVRWAVASHPHTSMEILQTLALDAESAVRRAVASHPHTSMEILHTLATDHEADVRENVARNTQTPIEVLRALATDESWLVRDAVSQNEQTPVEVLCTLATDPWGNMQQYVAEHPRTPVEVLRALANNDSSHVRCFVAANEQTPMEVLCTLATDKSDIVRMSVAANEQTPVKALRTLATDHNKQTRIGVVQNKQTPVEMLHTLAADHDADVRHFVARNKQTPVETLLLLAQDKDAGVRMNVALNEQTPVEVLRTLATDHDADVRWVANLVQKWALALEGQLWEKEWQEELATFVWDLDIPPMILDEALERQLGVTELEVEEHIQQTILAALADNWDATKIWNAFAVENRTSLTEVLHSKRGHYQRVMAPSMPPEALRKLEASPLWDIRYLVALHEKTPRETRLRLSQDGNRFVRAMARTVLQESLPGGEKE